LFRRAAYQELGGHEAVRGEVVEDLKLAQRVKASGRRLWMANVSRLVVTARPIGLSGLWHSWCRVAVDGLGRSPALAAGAAGAVQAMFLAPYVALRWPLAVLAAAHLLLTRVVRAQLRRA